MDRFRYVANRAEERRRGMQALDVEAISRLPEEYQQKQIDEMNEAIENDHKQHEIPEGLNAEQFRRIVQMRTDDTKVPRDAARRNAEVFGGAPYDAGEEEARKQRRRSDVPQFFK